MAGGSAMLGKQGGRNSVVECQLPKLNVVGSIPIARSNPEAPDQGASDVLEPQAGRCRAASSEAT